MDYFFIRDHAYLVAVDRYSGWPSVFHFRPGQTTARHLLAVLRNHFATFGIPEESSSDRGPQFESEAFRTFLQVWGILFRLSSVEYAQSNGRAEVGVKNYETIVAQQYITRRIPQQRQSLECIARVPQHTPS